MVAIGLIYILVLYLISSILNANFAINLSSLAIIGAAIFGGVIGGIVGVNMKWKNVLYKPERALHVLVVEFWYIFSYFLTKTVDILSILI